jgi:hypothetical protein
MDPFEALPLELAVCVLLQLERDPARLARHLRALLLVSKRWNAVATQPELWRDFFYYCDDETTEGGLRRAELLLQRARGGLRSLGLAAKALSCPLWEGAIQEACSHRALADLHVRSSARDDAQILPERIALIANTVGSSSLCRLVFLANDIMIPPAVRVARGILERSGEHLTELVLFFYDDLDTTPLITCSGNGNGGASPARPLHGLKTLSVSSLSPWLWQHLSRIGVKLSSVVVNSRDYCPDILQNCDPSGTILAHILDVLGGPRLERFTFADCHGVLHPSITKAVFEHPRRSLANHYIETDAGIGPESTSRLEELHLENCLEEPLRSLFAHSLPRLRTLQLKYFALDDTILGQALRTAAETLHSLEIQGWNWYAEEEPPRVDHTISAIGTMRSLRSLKIVSCEGVTHAMLEPILIGSPPDRPPLCAQVRVAKVYLTQTSPQFIVRLRESIRLRFPKYNPTDVNGY